MLSNIFQQVPELGTFANLDLQVRLRTGPERSVLRTPWFSCDKQNYSRISEPVKNLEWFSCVGGARVRRTRGSA
jgi:hypothetical protein